MTFSSLKFLLTHKITAGVLILLLGGLLKWGATGFINQYVKISSLPEPSSIALKVDVQQRFDELNAKLDQTSTKSDQRFDRLDGKIDKLMYVMIAGKRVSGAVKINGVDWDTNWSDAPAIQAPSKIAKKDKVSTSK